MAFKRKKNTKLRGGQTHGYGAKKKHRGAGNRGGRGRAGSGKRADQKKPCYQKVGKGYLGRTGFKSKNTETIVAINIRDLQIQLEAYTAQKLIQKQGDTYTINLKEIGYNKLLGSGKPTCKMNIKVDYASKGAEAKINAAGGKLEVLKVADEKAEAKDE